MDDNDKDAAEFLLKTLQKQGVACSACADVQAVCLAGNAGQQ